MSVRNAILGLLCQRTRYGYEVLQAFQAVAGGRETWDLKPAQVYTTLARLKDSGLVIEEFPDGNEDPAKRRYTITPAGKAELQRWFETPVRTEHQRDEFFLKLMLALATGEADPRRLIYLQRANLFQELHRLTALRMELDPYTSLAHILLLDQAVMHVEADLRWLEMIEARLDEVRKQPIPEPELRPRGRPSKQEKLTTSLKEEQ
ncbi:MULTISPECIES: PadR family transcriptional regulator [Anaerolinea]|uniref:PadR family transcriptional regulator n=1 Tax=Anaerolinea thermophila (strain DSM 14523 / JCM 11388 / NBRC 100420 / UNI-1) TaxID=926569 RepID=E8N0I2_ANATU|nr:MULTISPECIES: PadR family transcriptional regulator [Anaerolinea]BAJ64731.1 PadR family transcriptional regulator [Anaerolinea thermophila UNI-1]